MTASRSVRFEHTRVVAEFHLHDRVIRVDGSNPEVGSIISCETHKAFGDAAGTWTMQVKRSGTQPSWLTQVDDPEDVWVRIVWIVNGQRVDGMWGVTDSFTENVSRDGSGARVEVVTITGSDFGKVFEKTPLFINMHARTDGNTLPMYPLYKAVQENLQGSPDRIVRVLLDAWIGNVANDPSSPASTVSEPINDKQWVLPPSILGDTTTRYFYDWCRWDTISANLRGEIFATSLLSPDREGASLWDVLQEYMNGMLNEMWCDLSVPIGGTVSRMRPALFLRERPFPTIRSRDRWDSLPSHRLTPKEVRNRNIVSDGVARFNYWELQILTLAGNSFDTRANIQQIGGSRIGQPGNVPIYDLDSIRKHGLRRHQESTRYIDTGDASISSDTVAPWLVDAAVWQRMVHDWFVIAPLQYTGTIVTSFLHPQIRIGQKLIEERRDGAVWEYYIEGVSQRYAYPNEGSTTLSLTRGQPRDVNFLTQQYQKYAGLDIATLPREDADTAVASSDATTSADFAGANPETERAEPSGGADSPDARLDASDGSVTSPSPAEDAPMSDIEAEIGNQTPTPVDPTAADSEAVPTTGDPGAPAPPADLPPRGSRGSGRRRGTR